MRIEKLQLKDFRSHHDTSIEFDRFTFITGQNAAGKSSLSMAIEFLLTGRCAVTDSAGRGAEDLIRNGAREFYVSGQIGKTLIERTKGAKSHILDLAGKSGPLMAMQEAIYEGLGVTSDVLSAVLNSSRFNSMNGADQKKLLSQVLATDSPVIPDSIAQDVAAIVGSKVAGSARPLDVSEIDALYKLFYDERTVVNREIKSLGVVEAPSVPDDAPDYNSTRAKLNDLRREVTSLTSQKAREEERYNSAISDTGRRRKELTEARELAGKRMLTEEESERFDAIVANRDKAESLVGKINTYKQTIVASESEIRNELATKRATVQEKVRNIESQIKSKEEQIEILLRIKSAECPSCQRPLSAKDKSTLGSRLDDELTVLKKSISAVEAETPRLDICEPDSLTQLKKKLSKLESDLAAIGDIAAAENKMRVHREAIVEADRCERELKAVADPGQPDTTSIYEKIDELSTRIVKGEEVLAQVGEIERVRKNHEAWKEKKAELEAKLERLARLLDFFGPNGIKSQMIGDKIGPFCQAMNQTLHQFGYDIVGLSLEPYEFRIARDHRPGNLSPRQLSKSEGFRFGIAFQIALAMATGLKFVVIDEADMLIGENRSNLTSVLLESELDQAIILCSTDTPAPVGLPDAVKFVVLSEKAMVGV